MGLLSSKLRSGVYGDGRRYVSYYCPGCKDMHALPITPGDVDSWTFNDDAQKPTFMPSVLVRTGHYSDHFDGKHCWCTYYKEHPEEQEDDCFNCVRCHAWIKDGKIEFLHDCTHELRLQTVEMPDIPLHIC